MKTNNSGTHFFIRELIESDVSPPTRHRSSEVTQGVVRGAHAFILKISRFFGLAPLRFESRTNGFTVTLSNRLCICSYVLATISVITTILGLASSFVEFDADAKSNFHPVSRISQVVFYFNVITIMITVCVGICRAPKRMQEMLKFLGSIASVDKSIGVQYSVVTERKLCAVILVVLILFSLLITDNIYMSTIQAINLNKKWYSVTNFFEFCILWFMEIILDLQFAFTALSVYIRFQAVNYALALTTKHVSVPLERLNKPRRMNMFARCMAPAESHLTVNIDNSWMDSLPGQNYAVIIRKSNSGEPHLIVPPCEAIHQLASLHGTLCEVVHRINDSYGLTLIVILISTILHVIVTPYYLIMEPDIFANNVHSLILHYLRFAVYILRLFVIVEVCHLTITESKKTQKLVCNLMTLAPPTGALSSRLELFSQQLMLRSAIYSPLGMCTLDRPILVSIFSAVTTYLVILIQFNQ